MSRDHFVELGVRHVFGGEQPFGISRADRRQHLYCVGKTGTGKSTLFRNMLVQDIAAGQGVILLDPHGDMAEDILDFVPPYRTDDVIFVNVGDREFPLAMNVLDRVQPSDRGRVCDAVVEAFKNIWKDSWGPRLQYILSNCIFSLLECPNSSLLGVQRLVTDERYRLWVIRQVQNPAVKAFWEREFAAWPPALRAEAISPIQNKIGELLIDPSLRNLLGQTTSKFTPRFTLDHRRVLIANLAKGTIGAERSNLLGSLLVSQFQAAAMSRADTPEADRVDSILFVDEFSNFTSEAFVHSLNELRKYRLGIVLAGQFIDQMPRAIRDAVFGNVGSMVAFRVGETDAAMLSREFGSGFDPSLFSSLGNGEVCVKLLDRGQQMQPFLARTHPPVGRRYGKKQNIINRSRERYATPRKVVEDKIFRWLNH